jgi:hypothetical protein
LPRTSAQSSEAQQLSPTPGDVSWRHYFIDAYRRVVMRLEVRSAITGHSARMDESAGYKDGMATFAQGPQRLHGEGAAPSGLA